MVNKYFYYDGFREFGPFTAHELLTKNIRPDYKLRLEGEDSYAIAKEVQEVAQLFKAQIPRNSYGTIQNDVFPNISPQSSHQNQFERDMSFEQQDFNPDIKPNTENTSTPNWRELLLIGVLAFWLLESVVHWIMTLLSIDSWYGPGEAISTLLGVLFAFIPILIAVCIRQRNLRIIAVIIGSILTISILSKYFYWSFQVF